MRRRQCKKSDYLLSNTRCGQHPETTASQACETGYRGSALPLFENFQVFKPVFKHFMVDFLIQGVTTCETLPVWIAIIIKLTMTERQWNETFYHVFTCILDQSVNHRSPIRTKGLLIKSGYITKIKKTNWKICTQTTVTSCLTLQN